MLARTGMRLESESETWMISSGSSADWMLLQRTYGMGMIDANMNPSAGLGIGRFDMPVIADAGSLGLPLANMSSFKYE